MDLKNGKASFGGSGDYRLSWTTREDTARFMGYAFTHLSTSELSGKCLRIEGDNLVSDSPRWTVRPSKFIYFQTFNEVIAAYEKKTGKNVEATRIPREVLLERAAAGDIFAAVYHSLEVYGTEVGKPLDNDLFPGWNPKKVLDVIS